MLRRTLVTGAAFLALGATASAAAPRPALSAKGSHTLTVTGRHFIAGERVRVTLNPANGPAVRRARASARGSFTVTYRHLSTGPCDTYSLFAVGDRGSRAMLTRMHPDCLVR
jgi:hypothetical protein